MIEILTDPEAGEHRYRGERQARDGDVLQAPGGATGAVSQILPPV